MKLDATPLGKPIYEKFGFVTEYDIERWMLMRQRRTNLAAKPSAEIEDVLRLDREIFGADRSGLLRSLTEAAPDLTLVARQEPGVNGYTFGRRGSRADHLGPWMARNEDVASTLLDEFLHCSSRELVFVDCLRRNPWAVPLLRTRGFELSRPLTRMIHDRTLLPGHSLPPKKRRKCNPCVRYVLSPMCRVAHLVPRNLRVFHCHDNVN
jgi:Acetyltransferase (GNAT) domain